MLICTLLIRRPKYHQLTVWCQRQKVKVMANNWRPDSIAFRQLHGGLKVRPQPSPLSFRFIMICLLFMALLPASPLHLQVVQAQDRLPDDEIVYIDSNGAIRVWDPYLFDEKQIQWQSPAGIIFTDMTIADVNNDNDMEIIGITGSGSAGKVLVYDPVMNSRTLTEDGLINDVPWKLLSEYPIGFTPVFVGAGELDLGVNGDEIVVGYHSGSASGVVVLKGTSVVHEGTEWAPHITTIFDFTWEKVAVGNVDGAATDEIILIDEGSGVSTDKSKLHVYRVDNSSLQTDAPFYRHTNTNNKWRGAVVGEMKKGGAPEVVVYRSVTGAGTTTIFILQYRPDKAGDPGASLNEADGDALDVLRRPSWAFLANINGEVNGVRDFEAFFLREVREEQEPGKDRLFVVNRGDDSIDSDKIDQRLDTDNDWKRGVGGNVNGDVNGRDEVILMRSNRLRIYRYETSGDDHLKLDLELNIGTDNKTIAAGDLDLNGFFSGNELFATIIGLENGIQSGASGLIQVTIESTGESVATNITMPTTPTWVSSFNTSRTPTPTLVQIGIDATQLLPGRYSTSLLVTTNVEEVSNKNFVVPIEFEVTPAGLIVRPAAASFVDFPCTGESSRRSIVLSIGGTTDLRFNAGVVEQPDYENALAALAGHNRTGMVNAAGQIEMRDELGNSTLLGDLIIPEISASETITWTRDDQWVQVVSDENALNPSSTMTITIDTALLPANTTYAGAVLFLVPDRRGGEVTDDNLATEIPIRYLCASSEVRLPLVYPQDFVFQSSIHLGELTQ